VSQPAGAARTCKISACRQAPFDCKARLFTRAFGAAPSSIWRNRQKESAARGSHLSAKPTTPIRPHNRLR